jgi:hypothetical protein
MKHRRRAAVAAIVVSSIFVASIVFADEASDRENVIKQIDELLGSAASELRNAGSGSSGYVDSARSKVQQVPSKLSELERYKGSDSKAAMYLSRYPRHVEDFDRATRPFLELKRNQQSIAELPRRCQDLDRQLQEQAQRFERERDGEKIEELRRLALDTGSKAEEWGRDAERKRDEMHRWASEARNFSASDDNKWPSVKDALHDAVRTALEQWMRDFTSVEQACKDLRQRDRHPVVERVIRELSSTAKGKDAIYAALEEKLKRAESAVKDLLGDSSPSKMSDARSAISEVERLVRDLDNVKGTDKKANHIASQWPDYVRNFAAPAAALVGLKETQYQLDQAPGKCETSTQQLVAALKKFVDDKDPDGLTEGPQLADDAGEKYTKAIAQMENGRSTMRGLVSTTASFDARDERWSPLKRQMKETADKIYEYWDNKTKEVHAKCDDLAKGRRNPTVERFLTELGGKAQSDIADFEKLVKAWEQDARNIYTLDCNAMQEVWDVWCTVEFEPNEAPEYSVVEQKAAEIIDRSERKIDAILARLPALRETQKKLGAKAKYRDAVGALREEMDKQEGRLKRLKKKNGDWTGNNIPALQFTKTYGQQAHDRMAREHGCNVYDKAGYLSGGRPDCVVVKGRNDCWVYEFKPKDWNGTDRLKDYLPAVMRYHSERMQRGEDASSDLGGRAFQTLVEANCRVDPDKAKKDDVVRFQSRYHEYDRCSFKYQCPE